MTVESTEAAPPPEFLKKKSPTKKHEHLATIPDANTDAALLAELLAISNKHASSRFWNTKTYVKSTNVAEFRDSKTCGEEQPNEIHDSAQSFLEYTPEDSQFNQYWYSKPTIQALCEAIVEVASGKKIAFLSTPSLFFALPITERKNCTLFENDTHWANEEGFEMYDFEDAENINPALQHSFDMVVIDPPFITRDVWEKYACTAKILLKDTDSEKNKDLGYVIATTVAENVHIMNEFFHAKPTVFKPKIPNLVYQYNVFTNFDCKTLSKVNPEV